MRAKKMINNWILREQRRVPNGACPDCSDGFAGADLEGAFDGAKVIAILDAAVIDLEVEVESPSSAWASRS